MKRCNPDELCPSPQQCALPGDDLGSAETAQSLHLASGGFPREALSARGKRVFASLELPFSICCLSHEEALCGVSSTTHVGWVV